MPAWFALVGTGIVVLHNTWVADKLLFDRLKVLEVAQLLPLGPV